MLGIHERANMHKRKILDALTDVLDRLGDQPAQRVLDLDVRTLRSKEMSAELHTRGDDVVYFRLDTKAHLDRKRANDEQALRAFGDC